MTINGAMMCNDTCGDPTTGAGILSADPLVSTCRCESGYYLRLTDATCVAEVAASTGNCDASGKPSCPALTCFDSVSAADETFDAAVDTTAYASGICKLAKGYYAVRSAANAFKIAKELNDTEISLAAGASGNASETMFGWVIDNVVASANVITIGKACSWIILSNAAPASFANGKEI